jgi:hypothetical protein
MSLEASLTADFDEFRESVLDVNVDDASRHSMKSTVETIRDIVTRHIYALRLVGARTPGNRGEGPQLHTERAWNVKRLGEFTFTLRPDPRVADRAYYLEFGTKDHGPDEKEYMKFKGRDGEVIYTKFVRGVEEYGYWRAALHEFHAEYKVSNFFSDELEKEFERAFGGSL